MNFPCVRKDVNIFEITYVRKTNKMLTFLSNFFHLYYPRHLKNKKPTDVTCFIYFTS